MIEEVGAKDAFGRGFVIGTRREAAAEGGGRTKPLPGRGGTARPVLGGARRGGSGGLFSIGGGGGMEMVGVSFVFCEELSSTSLSGPPLGNEICITGLVILDPGSLLGPSNVLGGGSAFFASNAED